MCRSKYDLVILPVTSGFTFSFDIIQKGTRSLKSPDKVNFYRHIHSLKMKHNAVYMTLDMHTVWAMLLLCTVLIIKLVLFNMRLVEFSYVDQTYV